MVDDLRSGYAAFVAGPFVRCSIGDASALDRVFVEHGAFDVVLHFAASIEVGESVVAPLAFYRNNVVTTGRAVTVVDAARRPGDPAVLVADPSRFREAFGFTPERSDLDTIVRDAWSWHQTRSV